MTNAITNTVANKLFKFGADSLRKAEYKALNLFDFVSRRWKKLMMAPSNSVPPSVFIVIGLSDFHKIVSLTFVAMKSEIPEPSPYPF